MKVTMDRYNADWNIVRRGWETHVLGKGRSFRTAEEAVRTYYEEDPKITDQYMDSFVIVDESGMPVGPIKDGDSVIFFNFSRGSNERVSPVHIDSIANLASSNSSNARFK